MAYRNAYNNIGNRLGRLLQQYNLRIAYAEYRSEMYKEEQSKASALGNGYKSLQATISKQCWETYAKNLSDKRDGLMSDIKGSLVGYNDKQRRIWYAYFIENKSADCVADEFSLGTRTVERIISAMKGDMELNFSASLPKMGDRPSPSWSSAELANFLQESPSPDYLSAISDCLSYGIVDADALENDRDFQEFLERGGKHD